MRDTDTSRDVRKWLSTCLPRGLIRSWTARNLKNGNEREVWDCTFRANNVESRAILTVFKPGSLDSVNTSLPPHQAARKCALAMTELPASGIPTPRVLGQATAGRRAALLCGKVEREDWRPGVRIEAARVLSRIHNLELSSLSDTLRKLARLSDPREYRTTGDQAPTPRTRTLVHGDYFSANILPVADGLRVIDWETFGWGDPMWDLAFLVGADRDLPYEEVAETIAAYEENSPVDREQLSWHQRRWSAYWRKREQEPSIMPGGGKS